MPVLAATEDPERDWTTPGIFRVAPGVHRVPLPLPDDGLRAVNVYVVEDGGALLLIDGGWALAASRELLAGALAALGCGLADVRRFLVTHVHRDHYTQAVALRRDFGARVSLGLGEQPSLDIVADATRQPLACQIAGLRRAGAATVLQALRALPITPEDATWWEQPDDWVVDGAVVGPADRPLQVVATPGHTSGHVVYRDAAGQLLFAGDHVLPHITPSIGFEPVAAELPLRDYLDSLRLVRELPDTRLLPAHGPVAGSVHRRVDELLDHHRSRLAAVAGAVEAGADTGYQAAAALTWTRRARAFTELDPFNQMLAVLETVAHLDLLVAQGRLAAVTEADGVRWYSSGGVMDPAVLSRTVTVADHHSDSLRWSRCAGPHEKLEGGQVPT